MQQQHTLSPSMQTPNPSLHAPTLGQSPQVAIQPGSTQVVYTNAPKPQIMYTTTTSAIPPQQVIIMRRNDDVKMLAYIHLICAIIPIPISWFIGSCVLIVHGIKANLGLNIALGILSILPVIGYWGAFVLIWYLAMIIVGIVNVCT